VHEPARRGRILCIPAGQGIRVFEDELSGAVVTEVTAGSPAEAAGLKVDDRITQVDGKALEPGANLADLIQAHKPGDTIELTVMRGADEEEEEIKLPVTLGEDPNEAGKAYLGIRYAGMLGTRRGFRVPVLPCPDGECKEGEWPPAEILPFHKAIPDLPKALKQQSLSAK